MCKFSLVNILVLSEGQDRIIDLTSFPDDSSRLVYFRMIIAKAKVLNKYYYFSYVVIYQRNI